MARLTEAFIERVCRQGCGYYNNLETGFPYADMPVNQVFTAGVAALRKMGREVCGACGCSLKEMGKAGKACPLGYSGENEGIYGRVKGQAPKGSKSEG